MAEDEKKKARFCRATRKWLYIEPDQRNLLNAKNKDSPKRDDMASICGIIIGEASSIEEAEKLVGIMQNCPNLAASGTTSNKIYSVYVVPNEKEWWLKYPETNPKATGLEKALVYIVKNVSYPKRFKLRLPKSKSGIAPCGANCQTCQLKEEHDCSGCPATTHHQDRNKTVK